MKKSVPIAMLMVLVIFSPLYGGIFGGYDFSFFSSISNSLSSFDSDKVGVDYTGYGYLGDMTSGIFLRLGFQVPFSTVRQILDRSGDSSQSMDSAGVVVPGSAESSDSMPGKSEISYRILFAVGPSFRKFVSPELSWYMGIGLMLDQDRNTITEASVGTEVVKSNVGLDVDMGYRISVQDHATLRIGVYLSRLLFRLTATTVLSKPGSSQVEDPSIGKPTYDFSQTIFTPRDSENLTDISGYITLGYTFASFQTETRYRYVISSPSYGTGEKEVMM